MSAFHCFFCGGKECKYENWKLWGPDKYLGVNAIDGLYSSWITGSIVAMQRPSTRLIKEFGLIDVFLQENIRAIFNLQLPGEHLSCGDGVEPSSGFSYVPEQFMDSGISYYNFGWTDMETPDVDLMLSIVNVMAFAMEGGKKAAVHCHAGLGRTGLTIACYLIYSENIPAATAILIVRGKRPGSVQTKKQTLFVTHFENHLKKLKLVFPLVVDKTTKALLGTEPLSFDAVIANQRRWIKNPELRYLRYIPKVLHVVLGRILHLCSNNELEWFKAFDALTNFEGLAIRDARMTDINNGEWGTVKLENDVVFLMHLLLDWIVTLSEPLVSDITLKGISMKDVGWDSKLELLGKEEFETINFVLKFFREMPSISKGTLDVGMERLGLYLTSQRSTLSHYVEVKPPPVAKTPPPMPVADAYRVKMMESFQQLKVAQAAAITTMSNIKPMDVVSSIKTQAEALGHINPIQVINSIRSGAEAMTHLTIPNPLAASVSKSQSPGSANAQEPLMLHSDSPVDSQAATLQNEPVPVPSSPPAVWEAPAPAAAETTAHAKAVSSESISSESCQEEFVKLLLFIYKSFSVKEDNTAVSTGMKAAPIPSKEWQSPSEVLQKIKNGSTENLASVFSSAPSSQIESMNGLYQGSLKKSKLSNLSLPEISTASADDTDKTEVLAKSPSATNLLSLSAIPRSTLSISTTPVSSCQDLMSLSVQTPSESPQVQQ
ncbi:Protein tyrosine phosphatase domain-containing protein 1 [Kappamyces sp. JEL0829]|nr:Protein tyrosine phosphatase domain-containing protein 1 [Kappamyces sp. JEL0829]